MLVQGIKSRPVYSPLVARPGKLHLFVADAEGAQAILDLARTAPAGFFAKSHIIYVPREAAGKGYDKALADLNPHSFYVGPTIAAALPRLTQTLATAHMGTQIYLAGTEGLVGQAMLVALDAGVDHASIQAEHRGSEARRVQCVHCKGITENVTTQPVICAHCGLTLLVRDHYSRRIGAFQGVCIDAEEPGTAPAPEEVFK
ncbi:MAG: dimethylamine monooxygenase subunit DmmA family protein [Labrys sp. (in: a-proteobacteria)]